MGDGLWGRRREAGDCDNNQLTPPKVEEGKAGTSESKSKSEQEQARVFR